MESGQQEQVDELRSGLRTMWGLVAPGWEANADFIDARTEQLSEAMLAGVALQPDERVLELACGPGGLGLTAADQVGPGGEVVLSDVAPEMTAIAAERARQRGLENVTTLELDLERIAQPDDSYDAVLCREGIMLVPDPAAAAAEIHRVLRPGGRAAVSVWGPREENPWLTAMLEAVGEQLGGTFPPPGVPGPLSLGEDDELLAALKEGGFEEVEMSEIEVPWGGASFEEWWERTSALAGPVGKLLEAQPPEAVEAIKAGARQRLSRYESARGLEIPGVSLVAVVTAS